jgi:putative glycosyltransferase
MTRKLSVVATLYNSELTVQEFCIRTLSESERLFGSNFELILVDDGSSDTSVEVAKMIAAQDKRVKLIVLSRNFGHHAAILCGLTHSTGDLVFLIDSDLEEMPEWLTDFVSRLDSAQSDVVYGVQGTRKGRLFERASGAFFWKFLKYISGVAIPENQATVRLMSRRYVDALLTFQEVSVFFAGVAFETGFPQDSIIIEKTSKSNSSYTFKRKLDLANRAILGYSQRPLAAVSTMGAVIAAASTGIGSYLIAQYFIFGSPLQGWTSLMVSVWLLGGLVLLSLGVIGMYLNQVLLESKKRPKYIVQATYPPQT